MAKARKFQIIDEENGVIELEQPFDGDICIQYTRSDDGILRHIGQIRNARYGDKHEVKSWYYEPIAARLIDKFEELAHIDAGRILFLENTHWKPPKGGLRKWQWVARVKMANEHLQNIWGYDYIMEIREWFASQMTTEQIIALVYHELRHIGPEGALLHHDVEDWNNLVATLGVNWNSTEAEIMDLLGDEFKGFENLRTVGMQLGIQGGGSAALSGKG